MAMIGEDVKFILLRLKKVELQEILLENGLPKSGTKPVLVDRLMSNINSQDLQARALRHRNGGGGVGGGVTPLRNDYDAESSALVELFRAETYNNMVDPFAPIEYHQPWQQPQPECQRTSADVAAQVLENVVKQDPLYTLVDRIYPLSFLPKGRDTMLYLDLTSFPKFFGAVPEYGPEHKIMLYCTNLKSEGEIRPMHAWPAAINVLANNQYVTVTQQSSDGQHRSKALKERPCQLREFMDARPNNIIILKAAQDISRVDVPSAEWVAGIFHCVERSTEDLISRSTRLSKDEGLRIVKSVFGDGEVICAEMLLSLRDPMTMQRIKVPAKTVHCTHVQCFDAKSFFDFQRTAKNAKWCCFVCNKPALGPEEITLDSWFESVLQDLQTQTDVDQVEYFDDGTWRAKSVENDEKGDDGEYVQTTKKRKMEEANLDLTEQPCIDLLSDDDN
mmetsp:Transcript_10457/g.18437  ORF Transcript_10457/g.18437 Transcript_10457/m.18437 type:complete len:447 (+) Transcript_10457:674-2014(+)